MTLVLDTFLYLNINEIINASAQKSREEIFEPSANLDHSFFYDIDSRMDKGKIAASILTS